jgi:hemolysin activation/secretion protein
MRFFSEILEFSLMPSRFTSLCLTTALALFGMAASAQDFQREGPKAVPPVAAPGTAAVGAPANQADDSQVLLKELKSVVFVPTPHDVAAGGTRASGVVLRGVKVPSPQRFTACVQPYLGRPLTRGKLNALIADVISFYRKHDHPIVDVIVPQQEITNGVVQLVLLEGRVGSVSVAGNRWFSSGELASGVRLQGGDSIRAHQLQSDIDWLNQNPFHTTDVVYHPGKSLGETDIVLQTTDRFPVRFYGGYEDSGNAETGFDRYEAGFNWGDAFHLGLGQQLNYQYTTSGDGESLVAHAGSYVIPLPWRHTLTFFGSYADTKGVAPPQLDLKGRSYQISGRYGIPLPTLTVSALTLKETFSFGFDYKYNNNSLEFGGTGAGSTLVDVDQFIFAYDGSLTDPYGQTTLDESLYYSPGNWGGNNNDTAFDASHPGASSGYVYDTISLQRVTHLPENFSLLLRGTLQLSNGNLTPSEQLGYGGYDTVRGYDEREVNADEGCIFTTELRSPPISLGQIFNCPEWQDQLQLLAFWDCGEAYDYTLEPGEASEIGLSSVGGGVRYTINTYASVRFDYGFQLVRTGFDNDHGSRSDLGVVISY